MLTFIKIIYGQISVSFQALFLFQVCLVVNVASECGYTDSHYKALVRLQEQLSLTNKFKVLAFPCNQFGAQEPKVIYYILIQLLFFKDKKVRYSVNKNAAYNR